MPPSEAVISLLESGLSLDGCELLPAVVRRVSPGVAMELLDGALGAARTPPSFASTPSLEGNSVAQPNVFFTIELREGRNRQIRRMCELVGLRALRIHRLRIGNVHLGSLPAGRWRHLQIGESFM